jgi:multiple sugar transport system permease protein
VSYLRWTIIVGYLFLAALPLAWMGITSAKRYDDTISRNARFIPAPPGTTSRGDDSAIFPATTTGYAQLAEPTRSTGHSFYHYLANSVIIGVCSTLASVALGTACAYGFSRFRIAGSKDWLFFILSTRFMPPLAVVVPVFLMYRELNLQNSHLGLIILYTAFNLSLAVWLMKGFIDEIPRAYEEAALVDGYSRLDAFRRIILPQSTTGMAVTAVFCLISAWNEYGFAMTLAGTTETAKTVPVYFAGLQGQIEGVPWPQVAAGALLFVLPIAVFTVLVRKHLLRGVTFGTIKQ